MLVYSQTYFYSTTTSSLLLGWVEKNVLVQQASVTNDGKSFLWFPFQASLNGIDSTLLNIFRIVYVVLWINDSLQLLNDLEVSKRCLAVHHLIEYAA